MEGVGLWFSWEGRMACSTAALVLLGSRERSWVARHGMVCRDVAWRGVAWHGVMGCGVTCRAVAGRGIVLYTMARHATARHGIEWHNMT